MRVKETIDAHLDVNGGAYWVDGIGRNLFTQGRNCVVKRYILGKRESSSSNGCKKPLDDEGNKRDASLDNGNHNGDDNDSDDKNGGSDSSDSEDEDLETTARFCEAISKVEDCGYCAAALTVNPCGSAPPQSMHLTAKDVLIAIPKTDGRVSIYPLHCREGPCKKEEKCETLRFSPHPKLKLGMCMTMAFAEVNSSVTQLLVGYEDGSILLWSASCPSYPLFEDCVEPLYRLKVFFEAPVLSLDFSPRFRVGFAGSADSLIKKIVLTHGEGDLRDAAPSVMKVLKPEKTGLDFGEKGVSCVRIRTDPDRPKLAVAGGWNAAIYVFTVGNMKPLAQLDLHKQAIRALDFDAETGMMAAASSDSHVSLWRLYCDKKP